MILADLTRGRLSLLLQFLEVGARARGALLLANAVPLLGVGFLGWSVSDLFLLYWLETGIIGIFTILLVLRMASWDGLIAILLFGPAGAWFMYIHLRFIIHFFLGGADASLPPVDIMGSFRHSWPAILCLAASNGVAFREDLRHFECFRNKKNKSGIPFMVPAFARVIAMQLTLIMIGGLIRNWGPLSGSAFALPIIAAKTTADLLLQGWGKFLLDSERRAKPA